MSAGDVAGEPNPARALGQMIERELEDLRRGVEVLVWRTGLGRGREPVAAAADEILQEVVVRALARASVYDTSRSAHAWLYGIAVNVVRERRRQNLAEERRVQVIAADVVTDDGTVSEVYCLATASTGDALVELLDLVAPADREVLRCAFVEQLRGPALAEALGIKEVAARVRVSRALARLATEYRKAEQAGAQG